MAKEALTVRLDPELRRRLTTMADEGFQSPSELVKEWVKQAWDARTPTVVAPTPETKVTAPFEPRMIQVGLPDARGYMDFTRPYYIPDGCDWATYPPPPLLPDGTHDLKHPDYQPNPNYCRRAAGIMEPFVIPPEALKRQAAVDPEAARLLGLKRIEDAKPLTLFPKPEDVGFTTWEDMVRDLGMED